MDFPRPAYRSRYEGQTYPKPAKVLPINMNQPRGGPTPESKKELDDGRLLGGLVMPCMKWELKLRDEGNPLHTEADKPFHSGEVCHLCTEKIHHLDLICWHDGHPQHPMHTPCFEMWYANLDPDADIGRCPIPDCDQGHAFFNKTDNSHKLWYFRPQPSPSVPTEVADQAGRVFLTWILTANNYVTEKAQLFTPFAKHFQALLKAGVGAYSFRKMQNRQAKEWSSMSWPEQMEMLAAFQIGVPKDGEKWFEAANKGTKMDNLPEDAATRDLMLQKAICCLLVYVGKILQNSEITFENMIQKGHPHYKE